ncbi:MAG: hypothetical protein QOG73_3466 [Acetobacteraceae bacterium]|jgi:hypothetical protein|nr:hypothetical protein [Acetobacteraceae bacterium]
MCCHDIGRPAPNLPQNTREATICIGRGNSIIHDARFSSYSHYLFHIPPKHKHFRSTRARRIRSKRRPPFKALGSGPRTSALYRSSQAPAAGECGPHPAAEGATGPRKRSGKMDRDGQGSLESRAARKRGVRTDGVRGHTPESLRYRDRGGSSLPASRRWMTLSRRPSFGAERSTGRPQPHAPANSRSRSMAPPPRRPHGGFRRIRHAGAV